jgi:hypothetical protein
MGVSEDGSMWFEIDKGSLQPRPDALHLHAGLERRARALRLRRPVAQAPRLSYIDSHLTLC